MMMSVSDQQLRFQCPLLYRTRCVAFVARRRRSGVDGIELSESPNPSGSPSAFIPISKFPFCYGL